MEWRLTAFLQRSILFQRATPIVQKSAIHLTYKYAGDEHTDHPDMIPVVLIHDLLADRGQLQIIGKTMQHVTKRKVIAVDLRNHGKSPHSNSHTYKELAWDIQQTMKKLQVEKACMIGYGVGGRVAMTLSLLKPEAVAGIVVADMSPTSNAKEFLEVYPKVMSKMQKINFHNQKRKLGRAKRYAKKHLRSVIDNDVLMQIVLKNIAIVDGKIAWKCNVETLYKSFEQIASFPEDLRRRKYVGSALFIGGQLSDYIPPDDLPMIREHFPNVVVVYIPGTGHFLYHDDPKRFLELIITFLRQLQPRKNEPFTFTRYL